MAAALRELAARRSDIFWINPRELMQKPGWNSRNMNDPENKAHIASLKTSIRAIGVKDPLEIFREGEKIYISDGNCRHVAILELLSEGVDIAAVPVIPQTKGADAADSLLRQALEGKPKTAFELGFIFKQLIGYGWSEEQIAERSGKGIQSVRMSLELQSADPKIKKMVDAGHVSPTLAIQTVKKEGEGAAQVLSDAVNTAIQEGKSHATQKHIGTAPAEPRKARLTQVAEMIEGWDWDETTEGWCSLTITDSERTKLFKLLDI